MRWLRGIGMLGAMAGLLGGGPTQGQAQSQTQTQTQIQGKPPVLAPAPVPGGKFAPGSELAPSPAPPQVDKFAAPPVIPPVAPRAQTPAPTPAAPADKFGAAPPPATVAPPPVPSPVPPAAAPAPPIPADEPPALGQLRALLGGTLTYRTATVTDPATGALRLTGVVLEDQGRKLEAAELALGGLRPDGVASAVAQGLTMTDADGTVTEVARAELRDFSLTIPPGGGMPRPSQVTVGFLRLDALAVQGPRPVAIAELVVRDYQPGRVGSASIGGLDVLVPEAGVMDRMKIGRIALEGMDLAALLEALVNGEAPPRPQANYALAVEAVTLTQGDTPVGRLDVLRMAGVQGAPGTPDAGRLTLEGLRIEPFPLIADWLKRLGYPALTGDLSAETRFDAAAGRLELVGLLFGIRDAAALGLSVTLEGVSPETATQMDFSEARLAGFGLRYLDQSLLRRLAQAEAGGGRRTERQIRDGWASQAAAAMGGGGAVTPVLAAVQRLLRGQATEVTITAAPPKPVPVTELAPLALGGAPAVQRALGITATAR